MAVLTVDLDDNASAGLDDLEKTLDRLSGSQANLATETQKLTHVSENYVTVINDQRKGLIDLAQTGVIGFEQLAETGVKTFGDIAIASIKAEADVTISIAKQVGKVLTWSAVSVGAVGVAAYAWGGHKKAVKENEDQIGLLGRAFSLHNAAIASTVTGLAYLETQYGLLDKVQGKVAKSAIGWATGLGPVITGASVALAAYTGVLASTGEWEQTLADGTKVTVSNLEVVKHTLSDLGGEFKQTIAEYRQGFSLWWSEQSAVGDFFRARWHDFDEMVTDNTVILIRNIEEVTKSYRKNQDAFTDIISGDAKSANKGKAGAAELRERQAEYERITAIQQKATESIKLLNEAEHEVAVTAARRAEDERVANIRTVKGVDDEIAARREKARYLASQGKLDQVLADDLVGSIKVLTAQRQRAAEFERQDEAARRKAFDEQRTMYTQTMQWRDEEIVKQRQLAEATKKRVTQEIDLQRQLNAITRQQIQSTELEQARELMEIEKERAANQIKAHAETQIQNAAGKMPEGERAAVIAAMRLQVESGVKTRLHQMDMDNSEALHRLHMNAIDDEAREKLAVLKEQREKAQTKGDHERKLEENRIDAEVDKVAFERRKKQLEELGRLGREQVKIELAEKKQLEDEKFRLERERLEKIKAAQEQQTAALKREFDPKAFTEAAAQDTNALLRQLQKNRADEFKKEQAELDADLKARADAGDKAAQRKFAANQKAAGQAGARSAFYDADNGNIDQGEMDKAKSDLAAGMVDNLQKQGAINAQENQALTDALQTMAIQAAALQNVQLLLAKLSAGFKGQKIIAQSTLQNTQNMMAANGW